MKEFNKWIKWAKGLGLSVEGASPDNLDALKERVVLRYIDLKAAGKVRKTLKYAQALGFGRELSPPPRRGH